MPRKREVIRAQSAGFCWGVERAIDIARDIAREGQGKSPVYTDGPLIHNKQMTELLESEGIHELGDYQSKSELEIDSSKKDDAVLVVRAHGISPERRQYLKSLGIAFKDATCPDVGIIAGKIRMHAKKGWHTIIFGDPKHPEVIGLMGYAEGRGHVVQTIEDINALPDFGTELLCMVSQSTMFTHEFERLSARLKERFAQTVVFDTICGATKERQSDIITLKQSGAQAIVVIGGRHSANTVKLAALARLQNLPTFHIETSAELDFGALESFDKIGVTAGASTPAFIIDDVCQKLMEF
ncbi:MAG: 4-hydroxy-3-methylbut-2-enyl diphosphate reductase [Verrucomicrobia bacterium 21-51-4]|nr:MAG: 4-hydroxy-3-methylbut-2-enyl diphosphate reductase [Verrucomicrobia bacterium 21-51-4]HQU09290.1 4-hydroxy-3-methylbut-2-enyl diphosphate reductase [Opitutales bacterium]